MDQQNRHTAGESSIDIEHRHAGFHLKVWQHGHATWTCSKDMNCSNEISMQHEHAARICSIDMVMWHGQTTWTCSIYILHGHAAWRSIMDMHL
jgi:hypothetical protein